MRRDEQKIVMVTGKGGVGKSAVAAAIALHEARAGRKVLLVEMGERSFLRYVFANFDGDQETNVTEGLWTARWQGDSTLHEYLLHYLKVHKVVDLFFNNPIMRPLVGAAPALRELALIGKVTSGIRGVGPDLPYDMIVVDAYATGHFRALLKAPLGMAEAIPFGPMGEQSRAIIKVLEDPRHTKVVVVAVPEELPTQEAIELGGFLDSEVKTDFIYVMNKCVPLPVSDEEADQLIRKLKLVSPLPVSTLDFLEHLSFQGQRQEQYGQEIRRHGRKVIDVPLHLVNSWPELLRGMSEDLEHLWPK